MTMCMMQWNLLLEYFCLGGDSSTLAVYRLPVASWLSDVNAAIQQQVSEIFY